MLALFNAAIMHMQETEILIESVKTSGDTFLWLSNWVVKR
jgi:hypothetical protein